MKIICTVTNDLTYDRRMHRISKALAEEGHEVTLVGRRLPTSKPLGQQPFRQHRLRCFFQKGKLFYLEYNLRLTLWLFTRRYDATYSVDLDTLLPGLILKRLRRKRLVYDAHEYFTEVPEVVHRPITQWIWEQLARYAIPRTDVAFTVSPSLALVLSERYGRPFGVVRNLPPQQGHFPTLQEQAEVRKRYHLPQPQREQFVLLYQGALNEGRGLEATLDALAQCPHCVLWLAGEGDLSAAIRRKAQELALMDRVHFLGYVQPTDLPYLTPQAQLGVNLLAHKGLSYYYSLANKTFDYIQAEVPALHSNFPEYQALLAEHPVGVLVDGLSANAVAAAIQSLQTDAQRYAQLVAACRTAKTQLHWEAERLHLLDLIAPIIP